MSFADWFFSDLERPESAHAHGDPSKHPWWRVMCLTGVDYFSTLGYQSGIAFLAAGLLSPVATLVLVLVTLFAALPVYNRVAAASPYGQGSIAMLEKLFPGWTGKVFVLVLLGFATTDFVITMTLSAADAAAHFVHNPYTPHSLQNQMNVTLFLLAILGAIFLKGFKEAIDIAVVLVGIYLALNLIVTLVAFVHILLHPHLVLDWNKAIFTQHGSLLSIIGLSALLFPRLALGLSGFETGVAVMPLIECRKPRRPHKQHQAPAQDRRHDHERLPHGYQHCYHPAHPCGRLPGGRPGERQSHGLPGPPISRQRFRHSL